ncbi:MAG: PIN domain-containing protein [Candidatus Methanomethylicia archaeon]|nr:PIN domain-containing protein [Candidatus Methanomethylicia archaeon]
MEVIMYYIGTSPIIAYLFKSELHHDKVKSFLEHIVFNKQEKLYTSTFTLVELVNVINRKIRTDKLIEPLDIYIRKYCDNKSNYKALVSFIINFIKSKLNIEIVDSSDYYTFVNFNSMKIPFIFNQIIEFSSKFHIRIKDLLHIVYAYFLSRKYNIRYIITIDVENFSKIETNIKNFLDLTVIII